MQNKRILFLLPVLRIGRRGIIINIGPKKTKREEVINMATITKDTIIGDILDMDGSTAPFFLEMGMHCLGCPSARGETLEQACAVHGVDPDELVKKINQHLQGN